MPGSAAVAGPGPGRPLYVLAKTALRPGPAAPCKY